MRAPHRNLAVAAAALAAASWLDLRLAEGLLARPYDISFVPDGSVTRIASLGHRTLVSDLYWLSAVQYVGEPRADERGWDKLLPMIDLVTDLDPRHSYAYQIGGIVLSAAGRLDESNRILEKGIARGPPYWSLPYYRSFNAWFYRGDYEEGAYWARLAARTPGASANIARLALSLSSKSGTPEEALEMLRELRATVKDDAIRDRLDEQMKLAVLERDAQALERAVERFRAARGRDPFALYELVAAGLVEAIPRDPFGGEYVWQAGERKVRSSANPFRFQLREGPQRGGFQPLSPKELRRFPE